MTKTKQGQGSGRRLAFEGSISDYMSAYGVNRLEAVERIQHAYERSKLRNDTHIQTEIDNTNRTEIQMISHTATLATLILAAVGVVVSQASQDLNTSQAWVIMSIIILESLSLLFGGIDYVLTARFHKAWLGLYVTIDKKVDAEINNGNLQYYSDIGKIQDTVLQDAPKSTPAWVTWIMLVTCGLGLVLVPILFYLFFFT